MLRFTFIVIALSFSLSVSAKSLQEHFTNLKTWQADFVQTLKNRDTESVVKSEGKLWVKTPNRFRLEYIKPYKQIYVADSEKLWLYDEDLEQVTVKPQGNSLDQTPAMILSQPQRLSQVYNIDTKHDGVTSYYSLKPKGTETGFDHIVIVFEKDRLVEMQMFDHFAQLTTLKFSNIQINPDIPKKRFQFTPPADVDVIGDY